MIMLLDVRMMTRMMLMMIKCVLSRQVVACESAAPATNDFLITYCFCSHVLPILILITILLFDHMYHKIILILMMML